MEANFYLKQLIIQNFATFKNQKIKFRTGFNAIVGETGSGKSLVLDALQLILGGRADKKVVRRETEYSLLEASFYCNDPRMSEFLEQEGYPLEESEIVIKRLIYRNGSTKNYINHLSCTVSFLAAFSRRYIDIVGQFENQKLLSESYQLHLLDQFAKLLPEVKQYQNLLIDFKKLQRDKEALTTSKNHRDQRLDYLNFQLQEIERLNPSSQDEEDLLKKKNLILNLEKSRKLGFQIAGIFEGGEGQDGLITQFKALSSIVRKNSDQFQDQLDPLAEIEDKLMSLQSSLEANLQEDLDPLTLEMVLDRLDLYQKVKKKFNGTIENILMTQVEFQAEKNQLEQLDISMEEVTIKLEQTRKELTKRSAALHEKRKTNAVKLGKDLTNRIRELKMNGATIQMVLEKLDDFQESGMTKAFFMAETNKGEGYFKIKDTASGGELSRILLGVRQILSCYDSISIFLFDEIDTGIGGETATCIGKALTEVSGHGQVIAITHLPQIAQYAESLIVVHKEIQENEKDIRTESSVKEIFGKMIMKEVKAMAQLS
ncbi:MAG TPA: AAA family ATPase [Bacteriovoracaceae bacterium]|nr:AAA family ATPase [Bacteriovoracaceae bacterium]